MNQQKEKTTCGKICTKFDWRKYKGSVGPCMISCGVPMAIPGLTITLAALSDETGFPKFGAFHVIGMLFLAASILLTVFGCVFLCVWRSKVRVAPEPFLTHVSTHHGSLSHYSAADVAGAPRSTSMELKTITSQRPGVAKPAAVASKSRSVKTSAISPGVTSHPPDQKRVKESGKATLGSPTHVTSHLSSEVPAVAIVPGGSASVQLSAPEDRGKGKSRKDRPETSPGVETGSDSGNTSETESETESGSESDTGSSDSSSSSSETTTTAGQSILLPDHSGQTRQVRSAAILRKKMADTRPGIVTSQPDLSLDVEKSDAGTDRGGHVSIPDRQDTISIEDETGTMTWSFEYNNAMENYVSSESVDQSSPEHRSSLRQSKEQETPKHLRSKPYAEQSSSNQSSNAHVETDQSANASAISTPVDFGRDGVVLSRQQEKLLDKPSPEKQRKTDAEEQSNTSCVTDAESETEEDEDDRGKYSENRTKTGL